MVLVVSDVTTIVTYRIAYVALCIENSSEGKELLEKLRTIPTADSEYVQFGSAEWFWAKQVNSYVLQVEPERFKHEDQATIGYKEALHIQEVRDNFFSDLRKLPDEQQTCIRRKEDI